MVNRCGEVFIPFLLYRVLVVYEDTKYFHWLVLSNLSEYYMGKKRKSRTWIDTLLDAIAGKPADREALVAMIRAASDRKILDADVMNMMLGAVNVSDMQARDIMIPRNKIVYVSTSLSSEEALNVLISSRHSRFPVVGNGLDDIKGILHAKDLLHLLASDNIKSFSDKNYLREATLIPESKRLNILLKEFRSARNHMAIVIDEYSRVAGIVTIEDVLEQIVGDIEDEYGLGEEALIKDMGRGIFTVKAELPLAEFNTHFKTDFSLKDWDTIGGLVMSEFGCLPEKDDTVISQNLQFKVLNVDSRRIRLLSVQFVD